MNKLLMCHFQLPFKGYALSANIGNPKNSNKVTPGGQSATSTAIQVQLFLPKFILLLQTPALSSRSDPTSDTGVAN